MKKIRCTFNFKRMRTIPRRYFIFSCFLLLVVLIGFSYSLSRQYESKENTTYVAGTISNIRSVDTFNTRGSRFLLLFDVNDNTYYLWSKATDRYAYKHLLDSNTNNSNLYAEFLVSHQLGNNRVVDFICDGQVLLSIIDENEAIRQEKMVAFGLAILALALFSIIQFVILTSYNVVKFRLTKNSKLV